MLTASPLPLVRLAPNTSLRLATQLVGALRVNLAAVGPRSTLIGGDAHFLVASGLDDGPARDWSCRVFPYTPAGESAARAAFRALVSAAATVQA